MPVFPSEVRSEMKYYLANPIAKAGLDRFPATYEKTENLEEADIILVRSAVLHETVFPKDMLAIGRAGAGVNNIPLDRAAEEGIVVFNSPGANSNAVKELTLLGLFLASRDAKGGMAWVEENKGDELIAKSMEKAKSKFAGHEVLGKVLGVIGLGAIGFKLAKAAFALGMDVIGFDPFLSPKAKEDLEKTAECFGQKFTVTADVNEIYKAADYVTLHVPETKDTKGMVGAEALSLMKEDAALLNFARPGLVDEEALKAALEGGKLRKYVTDVPSFVTANLPNVIAFPHLGASTEEAEDASAVMAADEILNYAENGNIVNSVNFPKVDLGGKTGVRVSILFKAESGAEAALAELAAKLGMKSEVKTRGAFGAALFEGKTAPCGTAFEGIPGIIRIRVLE